MFVQSKNLEKTRSSFFWLNLRCQTVNAAFVGKSSLTNEMITQSKHTHSCSTNHLSEELAAQKTCPKAKQKAKHKTRGAAFKGKVEAWRRGVKVEAGRRKKKGVWQLKTWQRFTSGKPKEYYKQQQRQPQQQNAKTEAKRSKVKEGNRIAPQHIALLPAPHRKCMPAKWQWQHFRFRPCRRHRTVGKTLSKLKGSADRRTET